MKNIKTIWGAIRLCIVGFLGSLNVSPNMGAKTGVITAPTGADENIKTLGASQPVRETLAGIVRAAFQITTALKKAVINFGTRVAFIVPSATDVNTPITGAALTLIGTFTKTDPTKATSSWSYAANGAGAVVTDAYDAIVGTRLPALSVESLVNALEDGMVNDPARQALLEADGLGAIIVVEDQSTSEIKVYGGSSSSAIDAADFPEDAQFVQTLDSGGTQFGE